MMTNKVMRSKTYSTWASQKVGDKAKEYLAKYDMTLSEYMRLALVKAANHEVKVVNFLETPEVLGAKKEVEQGGGKTFDSLKDLWKDLNE